VIKEDGGKNKRLGEEAMHEKLTIAAFVKALHLCGGVNPRETATVGTGRKGLNRPPSDIVSDLLLILFPDLSIMNPEDGIITEQTKRNDEIRLGASRPCMVQEGLVEITKESRDLVWRQGLQIDLSLDQRMN
jgi:hypothetical protein